MNQLRPFQQACVEKFADEPRIIIGDDMGLGKTVEGIAIDKARREKLPGRKLRTLVICPMSLISSWVDHYADWLPELKVCAIDPKKRTAFEAALAEGSHDVYIMHWDVVRLIPALAKYQWFHVIADEAHRIANREAQVTIAAKKLKTANLTQLTGTPCTTRPEQFWSLLHWAKPKRYTSYHRFYNHHVIFIQHERGDYCRAKSNGFECGKAHKTPFKVVIGVAHVDELLEEIKPIYIRRLKEEVLKELPEKTYSRIKVKLDPKQRRAYNQMRDEMLAWIGEHEDEPLPAPMAIAKLVRLQQLACAYAETKLIKKRERDADGNWREVEKVVVSLTDPSSKLDAVMELIRDHTEKQFVIFSQSKQVVNLLAARLENSKISYGVLSGDTSQADRGPLVDAFQSGKFQVFVGTIQAGGVGLTLTAASTVIFVDRAWSPAINRQAEDRLHRYGQKNAVQVIDIIAEDTIDAGRLQKIELNWQYIKLMLGDKDVKPLKPEGAYV